MTYDHGPPLASTAGSYQPALEFDAGPRVGAAANRKRRSNSGGAGFSAVAPSRASARFAGRPVERPFVSFVPSW